MFMNSCDIELRTFKHLSDLLPRNEIKEIDSIKNFWKAKIISGNQKLNFIRVDDARIHI